MQEAPARARAGIKTRVLAPQQLAQRLVHQEIIFKNPIYPLS